MACCSSLMGPGAKCTDPTSLCASRALQAPVGAADSLRTSNWRRALLMWGGCEKQLLCLVHSDSLLLGVQLQGAAHEKHEGVAATTSLGKGLAVGGGSFSECLRPLVR